MDQKLNNFLNDKQKMQLRLARSLSPTRYYNHIKQRGLTCASLDNSADWSVIEREISSTFNFGARFIFHDSAEYPVQLLHTTCPPPVLVAKGDVELLNKQCVSIVGSRRASLQALKMSATLAKDLSLAGQVIVSGLAIGVDTAAHKAAIRTIGVLGCGINVNYPAENADLQALLAQKQLILTEYPFNQAVKRESFPARNRIVSGLSWATVVVEAEYQSGSMITAKHALAQSKEVFAVPGHPFDLRVRGCNYLIQQGAGLVQDARDILECSRSHSKLDKIDFQDDDIEYNAISVDCKQRVLSLLTATPTYVDEIARELSVGSGVVREILIELEAENLIYIDPTFRVFINNLNNE